MVPPPTILLAIKPLHYHGQQVLKEGWLPFIEELRSSLRESGFEDNDSSEGLLLFTFAHPYAAITSLSTQIHKAHGKLDSTLGDHPLPLQIIVHLSQGEDSSAASYRAPESGVWELLTPEAIYITKALKISWDSLMAQNPLPPCTLSNEGDGLFRLQFAPGGVITTESLLSCRVLSIQGPENPCFYCGMQNHQPSQCPSKFLTMAHDGLSTVGYLPFDRLSQVYHKVFTKPDAITQLLAAGITPAHIRKDPELMVFVGFFDINRVYQPRFLWIITFSRYSKWQSVFKAEHLQPDNKNLQLGMDCLRVGKYSQAEEFLQQECQAKSTKRFSAAVGLAFVALEQRGLADMRGLLELAKSTATQPKERVYIELLLSRFYELSGEVWKSKEIIKNILATQADCPDAEYRKLQLEVKGHFTEETNQVLRTLVIDQRTLYMTALMDAALIPIQVKVEDLLMTQYGIMSSRAQELLTQAGQEINNLSLWLASNDPQMQANTVTLDALKKKFGRKSYFDVIDVGNKTQVLIANSQQLREAKLNELYAQINTAKAGWEENYHFWMGYKYQLFFKEFAQRLLPLAKTLQEAGTLAKSNEGETYQKAVQLLREAEQTLASVPPLRARMNLIRLLCDSSISFAKKLALAEIGGILLSTTLILGLSLLPAGHDLVAMADDPIFQKKITSLTAFLIAPLLALSWTIKTQLRR